MRDINILPTWAYCLKNADGDYLYFGVTCSLMHRLAEHKADKKWWAEVATISANLYPTREQALTWEACDIRAWRPRYNREVPPEPVVPTWITDGSWHVMDEVDLKPHEVPS